MQKRMEGEGDYFSILDSIRKCIYICLFSVKKYLFFVRFR